MSTQSQRQTVLQHYLQAVYFIIAHRFGLGRVLVSALQTVNTLSVCGYVADTSNRANLDWKKLRNRVLYTRH